MLPATGTAHCPDRATCHSRCCAVLCRAVLSRTALCCAVLCCAVLCCAVLCCAVLRTATLQQAWLCYAVLCLAGGPLAYSAWKLLCQTPVCAECAAEKVMLCHAHISSTSMHGRMAASLDLQNQMRSATLYSIPCADGYAGVGECNRSDASHLLVLPAGAANSTGALCQRQACGGCCRSFEPLWTSISASKAFFLCPNQSCIFMWSPSRT